MAYPKTPLRERLLLGSALAPSGCLEWQRGRSFFGYGRLKSGSGRRSVAAHRAAWTVHVGPIPVGFFVCHRCDNPSCINVDHLFLGTAADNTADMIAKGRKPRGCRIRPENWPRGERNPNSKLKEEQVRAMRRAYAAGGTSTPRLAREYGVSKSLVHMIVTNAVWRHA